MAFIHDDERGRRSSSPLVEASVQIQRTMVIGLGGTGGEVIKRLKRRLGWQGAGSTAIRFLSLDTDMRTWLASLQFPALEPRERVPLFTPNPEHVSEAPHLYPTIQHLFHQGRRIDLSLLADASGAGLMPVLGRVAFHLNAKQVYASLQRGLRDLQAIPTQPGGQPLTEEFRIYIVASVAGGTGAGCFLETAVLVRHVFRSFKYQLIGVLALPEAFAPALHGQQLDAQSRGNAYAVLKELQYMQDGPAYWDDPETYTFQYALGGDLRTITLAERPFHLLYMIDHQNQEGGALRNLTDVYELIAQQLSVEIGSPLGAKFASAQANDRAIMGLAPCPETQRPANISSLATAALVVPVVKLTRYCSRRYLQTVIRERLLAPPAAEEWDAAAWLQTAGLEERGSRRMISHTLLLDRKWEREVSGGEFALDPVAALERPVAEFLAVAAAQMEHFTAQALPAAKALAERNLERLQAEALERLASTLEEELISRGVRGALACRAELEREIQAMATDLAQRQREEENRRREQLGQLVAEREALQANTSFLGGLFGRRRPLMRQLVQQQAELMQLDLELLGRALALRLVDGLRAALAEHRRRLEGLDSHLKRLAQSIEVEMAQEQWTVDGGTAYALETEVLRPDDYPVLYQRFAPSGAEPLLRAASDGAGMLAALGGLEYTQLERRMQRAAWGLFAEQAERLNVVDLLQELYTGPEAFALLNDLSRRCQPFWTAATRGAGAFSDVFLIGSPGVQPGGPGSPVQAEPLLQEWVEQHGGGHKGADGTPTYVALGAPGALIFSRQTHGARLHYMRQVLDYQEHYRALQQQRGYPVHFRPCLEALPELRPDDEQATESWALGVAYGLIAAKTFGWVWALDQQPRKAEDAPGGFRMVEVLRTGSLWDVAAEILPVEIREVAPHASQLLHATRSGALGQFSQRRECVAAVERLVNRRIDQLGKRAVNAELSRYLTERLAPRLRREGEAEAATLMREHAAVRRFLERLNL